MAFGLVALAVILFFTASSCSRSRQYTITGDTIDGKEITLRLISYSPAGVQQDVIATYSGHFDYTAPAPADGRPVYLELYTHDYRLVGLVEVAKGSKTDLKVDISGLSGFSVNTKNDKDTASFNNLINSFTASTENIDNSVIERFIVAHPDSPASYALLSTMYDASNDPDKVKELFGVLTSEARPLYYQNGFSDLVNESKTLRLENAELLCVADTFFIFNPHDYKRVFIAFTSESSYRTDSIIPKLQELSRKATKKELIMEHSLVTDTTMWRRQLRNDERNLTLKAREDNQNNNTEANKNKPVEKVKWTSVWTGVGPGAPFADRFNITALPYFVVADSTATVRYAGSSLSAACDTLNVISLKE